MKMKARAILLGALLAVAALTVQAQQGTAQDQNAAKAPESAKFVMDKAGVVAQRDGKRIMVIYHASWCGWCKKLDSVLVQKEVAAIMDKYFVTVHLTVLENDPKQKLNENPGGFDLMKAQGGEKAGLPFLAIVDAKGKLLVNSMMEVDGKKVNMGCPYEREEIENFLTMLRTSSPKITEAEIRVIWEKFSALKRGG